MSDHNVCMPYYQFLAWTFIAWLIGTGQVFAYALVDYYVKKWSKGRQLFGSDTTKR